MYYYKVFTSVFLALRFNKIILRILVYEVDIWFVPLIILLNGFYNEKYTIFFIIQTPGVTFKRVSEWILKKPFSARKCIIGLIVWKLWKKIFYAHKDQSLLRMWNKTFWKVTRINPSGMRRQNLSYLALV